MQLESAEDFLKQLNYNCHRNKNELEVDVDHAQKVLINFSNPEHVSVTDKLKSWNFLTGNIKTTLKKALLFNFVFAITLSLIVSFINLNIGLFVFITLTLWTLLWGTYYAGKLQKLKQILLG